MRESEGRVGLIAAEGRYLLVEVGLEVVDLVRVGGMYEVPAQVSK
jgi:hypothetical protein